MEAVRAPLACVAAMLQCWQAGRICGAGAGRAALTAVGLSWEKTQHSADISKFPRRESGPPAILSLTSGTPASRQVRGSLVPRWSMAMDGQP